MKNSQGKGVRRGTEIQFQNGMKAMKKFRHQSKKEVNE